MERIYRKYVTRRYKDQTSDIINKAHLIINRYMEMDLILTLRQLYYQFVAGDLLPEAWTDKKTGSTNNERSYKKLGSIVTNARKSGSLPWNGIEDRTRPFHDYNSWETPADLVEFTANTFTSAIWDDMPVYPEIWVEKDALSGIIEIPAKQFQIPWMAAKGYMSIDSKWRAAQRIIKRFEENGQDTVVIYLGDHDPSGIDMIRDIRDQLEVFIDGCEALPQVLPIALTIEQINDHKLPPNPTKLTDSRAKDYLQKYGAESWELDALDPTYLVDLIRKSIRQYMPDYVWKKKIAEDNRGKDLLRMISIELREQWKNRNEKNSH
jgi:hypothetical protein